MDAISPSRVIYIGDNHDNIEEHKMWLQVIHPLTEKYSVAFVMEMFRRSSQENLIFPIKAILGI